MQLNFEKMFNAKDKKIQLTEQYEIQMLYQTERGYREGKKIISEGEKIARNFAFIVTVMEYSRQKKAEKLGVSELEGDTLPIVLDGPFSKLGDENIKLIAGVFTGSLGAGDPFYAEKRLEIYRFRFLCRCGLLYLIKKLRKLSHLIRKMEEL